MARLEGALRTLAVRLGALAHADGQREARQMIADVTGLEPADQLSRGQDDLTAEQIEALDGMARRREAGEPLARILGRASFWDFEVGLNAATLVPRDDTGALVEAALALLPLDSTAHVVDLGTGSGIVLLALARERRHITGTGIDLDPGAVEQAERNAAALGLGERLRFQEGRWLEGFDGQADLIVSNPPYIRSGDMAGLAREVREHDPDLALVAGPDGLDAYRTIFPQAAGILPTRGHVVVEIGHDQAEEVCRLGEMEGLLHQATRKDLSGQDRAVVFVRP